MAEHLTGITLTPQLLEKSTYLCGVVPEAMSKTHCPRPSPGWPQPVDHSAASSCGLHGGTVLRWPCRPAIRMKKSSLIGFHVHNAR
ncbi:DUF6461 domain-containing protein [Streptosporangium sp. NPDC002544]|uniref:DUF6461 domain-containing protein n=1 Tax=Streptosporangium sp. NPDC002544 TaxID=3154538 RepID=UPI003333BB9C